MLLMMAPNILWVLNTELASCHPYGTYNFGVAHQVLENLYMADGRQQNHWHPENLEYQVSISSQKELVLTE